MKQAKNENLQIEKSIYLNELQRIKVLLSNHSEDDIEIKIKVGKYNADDITIISHRLLMAVTTALKAEASSYSNEQLVELIKQIQHITPSITEKNKRSILEKSKDPLKNEHKKLVSSLLRSLTVALIKSGVFTCCSKDGEDLGFVDNSNNAILITYKGLVLIYDILAIWNKNLCINQNGDLAEKEREKKDFVRNRLIAKSEEYCVIEERITDELSEIIEFHTLCYFPFAYTKD